MKKQAIIVCLVIVIIIAICIVVSNLNKNDKSTNSVQESQGNEYSLTYEDVEITPGKAFDENEISEEYSYYEIDSCAFDGKDKVYTYSGVEIDVAQINNVDSVYSVYFLDTETKTKEGVGLSDSKEDMIKAYGENYEQTMENTYTYTDGKININFIIENDAITSIEYTLIVKN